MWMWLIRLAPFAQRGCRISAAEPEVSGVEQETDVGELEHPLDLPRRLHERRSVVVERGLEATCAGKFAGVCNTFGEARPPGFVEADRAVCRGAAGKADPLRRASVCEHRLRLCATGGGEEIERGVHDCEVFGPVLRLAEPNRDVATDEREPVIVEAPAERSRSPR